MKPSTYSEYITKAVLADRESNIMVIRDLKIIKGLPFLSTEYPLILKLMKEKNIEGIVKLEKNAH